MQLCRVFADRVTYYQVCFYRQLFIDAVNQDFAFHGPGDINRAAWDTKLLLMAALAGIVSIMSHTEGIPLLFESACVLKPALAPLPASHPL